MQSNVVKKIKNRLLLEFETHDKSGIYGYSQRVMAYNSNKLEGSTLTENKLLQFLKQELYIKKMVLNITSQKI